MAYSGASLGNVMRHTHNGVILGSGGRLPPCGDGVTADGVQMRLEANIESPDDVAAIEAVFGGQAL